MGPPIAPVVTALSARFLLLLRLTMLGGYKIVGRLTILAIFKGQFSGVKHIDIIVPPTPPSISRMFSLSATETAFVKH